MSLEDRRRGATPKGKRKPALARPLPKPPELRQLTAAEKKKLAAERHEGSLEEDRREKAIWVAMTPKQRQFFIALGTLCHRLNVNLDGCGCCGSPFVSFEGGKTFNNVSVRDGKVSFG